MRPPHHRYFAFVLMPFHASFDDTYQLGIKGAVGKFVDIFAERVDEQIYSEGILERIYRQIDVADIVIADMTGQNPNVFYEVGYAHAKGKLCILLTSNSDDIPFDLKHRRHVVYSGSIVTLSRELTKELEWARSELEKQRTSHINVTPQPFFGLLTKTKYIATAEVTIKIDLENTSQDRAVNVQAMYFYSSERWTLYQEERECPSSPVTELNLQQIGWDKRHFLQPPLTCLQKGSWAQLKFKARRTIATAFKGEALHDSYQVGGRSLLRLVTSDGNFDYEIAIDVTVDEVPF